MCTEQTTCIFVATSFEILTCAKCVLGFLKILCHIFEKNGYYKKHLFVIVYISIFVKKNIFIFFVLANFVSQAKFKANVYVFMQIISSNFIVHVFLIYKQ